jgi:hypothetical protein
VLALTCGHTLHTTQQVCCKTLTCAAKYLQILAADQAGRNTLEAALKSCHDVSDEEAAKCKIDKALEREGLQKSTAARTANPNAISITTKKSEVRPPPNK